MATVKHILDLHKKISFDQTIGVGGSVVFYSNSVDPFPDAQVALDNTSFNLLSADDDYLLHVSFRRVQNAIIFNTLPAGGDWQNEEIIPLFGVLQKTDATVVIRVLDETFDIYVNGARIMSFKKRINKDVKGARYDTDCRPYFSDPVVVTLATASDPTPSGQRVPSSNYRDAYFPLEAAEVAKQSENEPFDYVIIGSGIGGGVLAADLLDKNKRLTSSTSDFTGRSSKRAITQSSWNRSAVEALIKDDRSKRILVIERGGLVFNTHTLNTPRPTSRGTYGQMNDLFYNHFKEQWDMDDETAKIWKGGPVFCLGGRSAVWGLFSPRISDDTFKSEFPVEVYDALRQKYLRKAEEIMNLSYPETLPLHRALMDELNIRPLNSNLPRTQWEWGRIASEFKDPKNFDFAEGAFSTIDRLLEAGMDDPRGVIGRFKTLLESPVSHLEPRPVAGEQKDVTHVVVVDKSSGKPVKIKCKNVVIAAGAIESPAILLRSAVEDPATLPKGSAREALINAYGEKFQEDFGHVTDHYIFYVTLPFFYRNMENKNILGGMKLQSDITFDKIDQTTALANISLDASGFLPRRNVPDSDLPQFIISYILPSDLQRKNNIELNTDGNPRIKVGYARTQKLEEKKALLIDFAVNVMNKLADVLDIQFVKHPYPGADYTPLEKVVKEHILPIGELGPGGVAHEVGSIPMPNRDGDLGVVDKDLKLKYGWNNVHVCDLSVFPHSPAANPTLSLAALSLRLSDHLVPDEKTLYQPIVVYNLLKQAVFVEMTHSNKDKEGFGPAKRTKIESGKSDTWKRETKETISVYPCACAVNFSVQLVHPGANALITTEPPKATSCSCK